jgi:transposase
MNLLIVEQQPDLTLVEIVAVLRKQRIVTSRSSVWRFFERHKLTFKKKACTPPSTIGTMLPAHVDRG